MKHIDVTWKREDGDIRAAVILDDRLDLLDCNENAGCDIHDFDCERTWSILFCHTFEGASLEAVFARGEWRERILEPVEGLVWSKNGATCEKRKIKINIREI